MWFRKKNRAEATGELPIELTPAYSHGQHANTKTRMHLVYWTHVGMVRQNNEDSFCYSEEIVFTFNKPKVVTLAAVADGMGGLDLGEEASSGAVTLFQELVKERLLPRIREQSSIEQDDMQSILLRIVTEINDKLYQHFQSNNGRSGSTLSAVVLLDNQCHLVHVGDSRIYVIDHAQRQLKQITTDHSYVYRLVQMGQISADEARTHPRKNEIYKMLAFESTVEADYVHHLLESDQALLICSDGLTDMVTDDEILEHTLTQEDPQAIVDSLGHLANSRGGFDNCTILYLKG